MRSRDIDSAAAAWAARVDRAPLSAVEQADLEQWLSQDRRHLGAFARARAIAVHFDRASALGKAFDFSRSEVPRFARIRRAVIVGAGVTFAAALAAFALRPLLTNSASDYTTPQGEVRRVPLDDGSAMTLNTATQLDVLYSRSERTVTLKDGEALFNVAKDPNRPFIVRAGETTVRAVGTSFAVRRLPENRIKVVVREGVVEVTQPGSGGRETVRVSAHNQLVTQPRSRPTIAPVPSLELERALAWQQGMISFDGVPLREAAAEFQRYGGTRILIDDPEIANRTVTGLFSATNPVGFARAVANSMDLKAQVEDGGVRLSRN
jgi:transmembrane sensor